MNLKQLLARLESLTTDKLYIKKKDRDTLKADLKFLQQFASKDECKKLIELIEILSNEKINVKDKNLLIDAKPFVINIIKKYEEEFNEEPNEDNVDDNLSTEQIEELLDTKIPKYNNFNDKHPMDGITFDKSKNKYQIKYKNINTYSKTLEEACNKIYDVKNPGLTEKNYVKYFFVYKNHYFIAYLENDMYYFDIQHIISILNLKKTSWNDKYNTFSDKISNYIWHKNEFGGYILRELIEEQKMYELILSSNSSLSKSFKTNVAKILVQLRKKDKLEITNDEIKIKKSNKIKNQDHDASLILSKGINEFIPCNYNNIEDQQYAQYLIANGSMIPLSKYIKRHTLYAFIIPIKLDHKDIIIKIGYSEDIIDRIQTLQNEYKSVVYLIKIKLIKGKSDEEEFHKLLKNNYQSLIQNYSIDGKKKIELYKLCPQLLAEFDNYLNNNSIPFNEPTKITDKEQIVFDAVKKQEAIFLKQMMDFEQNFKLISCTNKNKFDYLIQKENYFHDRIMKDKEIELSKIQTNPDSLKYLVELEKIKNENLILQLDLAKENDRKNSPSCNKKKKIIHL